MLIAKGRLPENTPPSRVRIRDKIGNNPAKILKDNRTFVESQVYLFDGKVFAFQILDDEEELPEDEPGSVVILAQRWYRSTWSLGPRIEVYLRGSLEVQAVASGIAKLFDINFKSMLTLVVPKDTEFLQSELQSKSPARNYGRTWFDPTMETKPLKFMSHDMRMQEGDLLLVQDYSEPLKELSVADLKSIELVEIASKSNNIDFYSTQGVMLGYGPKNYGESTSLKLPALVSSNNTTTGNGIKIKTHKERIKEQSINIPKDSSTSPLDNDSKSVSPAPDVSPNDGNYITLNELSSMDLSSRVDNDNELIDNDEKEFCKQGGLALFDDIC